MAAKEAVNQAFEGSLSEGVRFERRLFHALFATRRPKRGHGCVHKQAQTRLQTPITKGLARRTGATKMANKNFWRQAKALRILAIISGSVI